jgi:hypothetical protein
MAQLDFSPGDTQMNVTATNSNSAEATTSQVISAGAILEAAAKTPYLAPSVVSFSIDGMSNDAPIALAGNV